MQHIVIIGNGISGVTAARHIRKRSKAEITIISSEHPYFFSRTALMYVFMGHMKLEHTQPYENWFWKKNNIHLKQALVKKVVPEKQYLLLHNGDKMAYDKLIIATGSKPNKFGWPGENLDGVLGLYHKQDLEALEKYSKDCKRAVIVGGGLIGIEMAEMLRSRNIPVSFLVRESNFWNGVLPNTDASLIRDHILDHHIDLRLDTNLVKILSDDYGRAKAVVTDKGETIACNIVGLTAGVRPNIDFLKHSGIDLGRGVKVNAYLQTNLANIYAIGDCAEQMEPSGQRRAIEAVWYTGRMMGETVAQTICGTPTAYAPGNWFNSAKFLDIEYQTYGWVLSERHKKEEEQHYHWRHAKENIAITVAYDRDSLLFLGINTFGIRMRHMVLDKWLKEKRDLNYVLRHLRDANFDPEFYRQYEVEIVKDFNKKYHTNLKAAKKSWKRILNYAN
ncbi:MAG: FAD-dependent oxidoreductase [Flavobacteriaceae bacterium]|nr:FAD-dependent oxidoreductase [Flavobacteriaceae bacterium]